MALRMNAKDSLFVIVDVQEKLADAMFKKEDAIAANVKLLRAATILNVPHVVTEQYPEGIGYTQPELAEHVAKENVITKMTFSAMEEPSFVKAIDLAGPKQIVISGMETHVCVLQTALDLIEKGYQVFVVEDAVASRTAKNKMLGIERLRQAGAQIVCAEMVMFEWLGVSGTDNFKAILPLIK
ncbi:hydrolase [Terasakiella sp. A23]|uniref:hydrolase n=1 Tax=Terasakiella sp. FCG-A23 TaxID=3080561 RepID=UPI002953F6C8|nr:hydrolase [Terasakiella sp. A23]MDV7340281.1 hydrolase [Terasakiella sp. A23]